MVSAQKQEISNDTALKSARSAPVSGFAKVLGSLQGLQQRLDDFSLEEVNRAHAKAHDLIRRLRELQGQFDALAKLTDDLARANAEIRAIPEANFEWVGLDSLEKYPQLRAIVQADKLIRMHRFLPAAPASTGKVSCNFQMLPSGSGPLSSRASPILLPEISPRSQEPVEAPFGSDMGASDSQANAGTAPEKQSLPFIGSAATQQPQAAPTYEFAELKLDPAQATVSRGRESSLLSEESGREQAAHGRGKKPAGKPHFDERLLNDLIQTYGEFALSTGPVSGSATAETNLPAPEEVLAEPAHVPPVDPKTSVPTSIESAGTGPMLPEPASVEIAFVQPAPVRPMTGDLLALPAPEPEISRPAFEDARPLISSHGEFDRQLKNIIKDYGEYDLYSHKKKLSIKTAAIAVIAALLLVLGGLYFFNTVASRAPAAIETMMPAGQPAVETEQPAAKPNLKPKT